MSDLQLRAFELEFDRHITKLERKMVKIVGKVNLGGFRRPGWTGDIDFYLFKCETHGLVVDYAHGHSQTLSCPVCVSNRYNEPDSAIGKEELAQLTKELRDMEQL